MVWNGTPKAISHSVGTIDVFCIGSNSTLHHLSFSSQSGWHKIHKFSGSWISDPEAVSGGPNRIDLFILGYDSTMSHASFNRQTWTSWTSLAGMCMTPSKAVRALAKAIHVFTTGIDGGPYNKCGTGDNPWFPLTLGAWEALGGVATSQAG